MPSWTTAQKRYIIENAGKLTLREMACNLGRSYASVRNQVERMRKTGEIDVSMRIYGYDNYIHSLTVCVKCNKARSTCDKNQVCKVCRDELLLERHIEQMHRSYANLPKEIQEKTNGTFELQRSKNLMKTKLEKPKRRMPDRPGSFWAEKAEEDYARAVEAYELRVLKLDIDAAKQRRSKWNRKAAKYRAEKEGRY